MPPFSYWINDELLLIRQNASAIPSPPIARDWGVGALESDPVLLNVMTGEATPIATSITTDALLPNEGFFYLDLTGDEPGLWAYPLPFMPRD